MIVSPDDPRQPRVQIADALRAEIQNGSLGGRMPPIRDIGTRFGVAKNTAQAAVEILKAEGLLVVHGSRGVFVAEAAPTTGATPKPPDLMAVVRRLDELNAEYGRTVLRIHEVLMAVTLETAANLPEGISFEVVPEP